jgi:hypothetical protein
MSTIHQKSPQSIEKPLYSGKRVIAAPAPAASRS